MTKKNFDAEISKILEITSKSVYSERRLFIRELISNASDACQKLNFEALNNKLEPISFKIRISTSKEDKTITIEDNGIGMNEQELTDNLGTIAKSGTEAFANTQDTKDTIGMFGIGFYSAFMVAKKITVYSKRFGEEDVFKWESSGPTGYTVEKSEDVKIHGPSGCKIILDIKDDAEEFLSLDTLKYTIKKYSDYILTPIYAVEGGEETQVNSANPIWRQSTITQSDKNEYFKSRYHSQDNPLLAIHINAEGNISYKMLLYILPTSSAMMNMARNNGNISLYSRGVLIIEKFEDALPKFLRFIDGIMDCDDLDLNVSREIVQQSSVLAKFKQAAIKKVLQEIAKAKNGKEIFDAYGQIIKEGICDFQYQEQVLGICRFHSTHSTDSTTTLEEYIGRAKDDQDCIYYMHGQSIDVLRNSANIEKCTQDGVEVILLADMIDAVWIKIVSEFKGKKIKSISNVDDNKDDNKEFKDLIEKFSMVAPKQLSNVVVSRNLVSSPACINYEKTPDHIAAMMNLPQEDKYKLEINVDHEIVKKIHAMIKINVDDMKRMQKINHAIRAVICTAMLSSGEKLNFIDKDLISSMQDIIADYIN